MAAVKKSVFLLPFLALCGCSFRAIALRSTTSLLDRGASALYEEPDPDFARESMASQLKLIEALLRNDPGDSRLLLLAAEGFDGYSFLFVEGTQDDRAKGFYLRGRDYALAALARAPGLAGLTEGDLASVQKKLAAAGPAQVPALFWAGFGWAGWINLSKDDPAAVAELPRAVALMQRVEELAPDFHFAGADLFFGTYYASRPAILGGDVAKAKAYFQEARRRTGGRYLMTYVLEARYYAVAAQDKELFKSLLGKATESQGESLPNAGLTDAVARRKAAALLEKTDDLF